LVHVSVGDISQTASGEGDHFIGNIDPVNFVEMGAHGPQEAAGPTADLQGAPLVARRARRKTVQIGQDRRQRVPGGRAKLVFGLPWLTERYVVVRISSSTLVPLGAHHVMDVHQEQYSQHVRQKERGGGDAAVVGL
jgi:hypothetical protein